MYLIIHNNCLFREENAFRDDCHRNNTFQSCLNAIVTTNLFTKEKRKGFAEGYFRVKYLSDKEGVKKIESCFQQARDRFRLDTCPLIDDDGKF